MVTLRCGDRCCPECRVRDFFRLVTGYLESVKAITRPKLLTLTVRNVPELTREYIRWVRRCFTRLMRRKYYREHVKGGLQAVEVTNKGKGWHVHLHVVIEADYLPQKRLAADWCEVTGGSPIVDIRAAGTVGEALKYCLKYLSKAPRLWGRDEILTSEEQHERKEQYRAAVKGVRLVQAFGSLYDKLVLELPELQCRECGSHRWICWEFECAGDLRHWRDEGHPSDGVPRGSPTG